MRSTWVPVATTRPWSRTTIRSVRLPGRRWEFSSLSRCPRVNGGQRFLNKLRPFRDKRIVIGYVVAVARQRQRSDLRSVRTVAAGRVGHVSEGRKFRLVCAYEIRGVRVYQDEKRHCYPHQPSETNGSTT